MRSSYWYSTAQMHLHWLLFKQENKIQGNIFKFSQKFCLILPKNKQFDFDCWKSPNENCMRQFVSKNKLRARYRKQFFFFFYILALVDNFICKWNLYFIINLVGILLNAKVEIDDIGLPTCNIVSPTEFPHQYKIIVAEHRSYTVLHL